MDPNNLPYGEPRPPEDPLVAAHGCVVALAIACVAWIIGFLIYKVVTGS